MKEPTYVMEERYRLYEVACPAHHGATRGPSSSQPRQLESITAYRPREMNLLQVESFTSHMFVPAASTRL